MSYNTFNIITAIDGPGDYTKLHTDISNLFPQAKIRRVIHPFKGIVGQIDLKEIDREEIDDILGNSPAAMSKLNPEKKIAFIEVDCFGGQCTSEGKVMLDGEVILDEEIDQIAHVKLLKLISDNYQTWHFEPFTREYFEKKGGIWGQINDGPLKFFGLGLAVAYKDNPLFRVDMTMNELLLQKFGKFTLYLMEPLENTIKVLGSVYDDSAETLDEITAIINEHILYAKAYVFIELIDKDELIKLNNFGEDGFRESLYRFKAFNEQTFPATGNTAPVNPPGPKRQRKEVEEDEEGPTKTLWETIKWFFGK